MGGNDFATIKFDIGKKPFVTFDQLAVDQGLGELHIDLSEILS